MTDKNDYPTLANADLIDAERSLFCDARPVPYEPYPVDFVEKFANWVRANSLWVLAFGTGCGAIELNPLMTSRFDANRYGIQMRPTPRQSCVIVVAGYSSVKTLKRIIRSYEQMQGPKFVLGLGICSLNGGMYWDSYNTIKRIDQYIPIDLYVTGCMPRPEALLAGFIELKDKIKAGQCDGTNRYVKDFDWYKANQKKVIKNWDMPDYNW
ncbi:MAG: NADH-quinone oxidoreductase subunit NuoB [Methylococcales bacterium]|jgi:NADH-quinone oxidoreductase subunit B|nr:NADH-quinone oxidoreductase subunit NuoB [Methylococcales bacterium]MBT7445015.1 NADH-quinone oxidoreductase subunit NuoB [Methylococcales bacterium]